MHNVMLNSNLYDQSLSNEKTKNKKAKNKLFDDYVEEQKNKKKKKKDYSAERKAKTGEDFWFITLSVIFYRVLVWILNYLPLG